MHQTLPFPRTPRAFRTVEDLLEQLGNVSPRRVRMDPTPGTATERDLLDVNDCKNRLYELVDGVLVEKAMGFLESALAMDLGLLLGQFLQQHDLGLLTGEAGMFRLLQDVVRLPDLAFVSWDQLPNRQLPTQPVPDLAPALAVEILSEGNTEEEMQRKLSEYFRAGVRLVWQIDPRSRTVQVFTAATQSTTLTEADTLTGGDVLPGFTVPVRRIFAKLPSQATKAATPQRKSSGKRRRGKK
jgi:Uma2 family endonuclease